MAYVKPSWKTLEGQLTFAVNAFAGIGTLIAYAANHHVFAADPRLDVAAGTALLAYNSVFTFCRTWLKAAAAATDTAIAATTGNPSGL